MLVIETAARLGSAVATALFRGGFVAFLVMAAADLAAHLSLIEVAEAPVHLALVAAMGVTAGGLVVRGSLVSPATGKERGHAHR